MTESLAEMIREVLNVTLIDDSREDHIRVVFPEGFGRILLIVCDSMSRQHQSALMNSDQWILT